VGKFERVARLYRNFFETIELT